ncbi:MAG: hypothetical protein IBX45_13160 [Campylobacterales bacterium]|nr:hypothetical protein [Campylobacterales bacterium]
MLGLLESMEEKGYNASLNPEHPRIMIGRNGELIKTRKGRHRFSAAQIVGAKNIVVEIDNIHPLWLKKIEGDFKGNVLKKIKEGLKCIELKHTSPGKDAQ